MDHEEKAVLPGETHTSPPGSTRTSDTAVPSSEELDLPPVDRGRAAWGFMVACWAVEALVFGFGFSFGIFQEYYSTHPPFAGSANIAVIGTTTMGTMYIGTPFVIILCLKFRRWARWLTPMGLLISSLAMVISSFCQNVPQLIGVQGVLFGVGGCLAYCPCNVFIDEWFDRRKGMAYGVVWSAAGFGGVVLPLILEALLGRFGFRTAARIWAAIFFACSVPLSFFVKPRLPAVAVAENNNNNAAAAPKFAGVRFLRSGVFLVHQLANLVQATGYFLPGIYLPTYARVMFGTSRFMSALTVMLINITAAIGNATMGTMTDKLRLPTCILISSLGASTAVLALWGCAVSLPVLYVFCAFYGLFGGAWTAVWPGIMRDVARRCQSEGYGRVEPVMVFGYLSVGRGVGNFISGPLSEALLKGMPLQGQAIGGYGSGYGSLVIYAGLTALLSGISTVWRRKG